MESNHYNCVPDVLKKINVIFMTDNNNEIEDSPFTNPEYIIGGVLLRRTDIKLKDLVKRINDFTERNNYTIEMVRELISKMDSVELFMDKRTEKVRNKKTW